MPHARRGLLLVGALVLAGCGAGGDDTGAPEQPKVTNAQLAAMVLPQGELGGLVEGFEVDDESGLVDNATAAEATVDPLDTADSLRGRGRVSGHQLNFVSPRGVAVLAKGKGVYLVGSEVSLLEDTVYAAQHLAREVDDYESNEGRTVDGVKIGRVGSFPASGVGDEAHGLTAATSFAKMRMHVTVVVFRRGRLVAAAGVARGDKQDMRDEAAELAAKLDARIQAVLAGEIAPDADGVAVKNSGTTTPFAGREELPERTLAAEDVVPGAAVSGQGRGKGASYVSYYRTFDDVVVGRSHLLQLRAETQLYRTPDEAAVSFRVVETQAGRREFARGVVKGVSAGLGWKPDRISVRPLPVPGKDRSGLVATFAVAGQRYRVTAVFVRSGRLIQVVSGTCTARAMHPPDMLPVARRAAARLAA